MNKRQRDGLLNDDERLALAQELYKDWVETTDYFGWAVLLMLKPATENIPRVQIVRVNSKDEALAMALDKASYYYSFKHPKNEWMSAYYFNCEGGN